MPEPQSVAQAEAWRDAFVEQERALATKTDFSELRSGLQADMVELRTELKADMAELRTDFEGLRGEVRSEIATLRLEGRTEIAGLRTDFAQFEARLTKWMLAAAGVGGLLGGAISVATRLLNP